VDKQLIEVVLPRLARPLYKHLERYQTGKLSDAQFNSRFEALLRRQHAWLEERGIAPVRAAIAIHAAVLVLSLPGLRAEAVDENLPLEVIERRALDEAAIDIAGHYHVPKKRAANALAALVAHYSE
jgi:hypothetical protein